MSETANGYSLQSITSLPFKAKADRERPFAFGSLTTTEVCNLECVMCHFNGPNAVKKGKQLSPENVERVLNQLPSGSHVYIGATGEYFMDSNALQHIEYAVSRNLKPQLLSHGQLYTPELLDRLLAMGVRNFRISCDAIDDSHYARIRRGGEFQKILAAVDHLNKRRKEYCDLLVEINCTLFKNTFLKQKEFETDRAVLRCDGACP